jgi:hypothetical protein
VVRGSLSFVGAWAIVVFGVIVLYAIWRFVIWRRQNELLQNVEPVMDATERVRELYPGLLEELARKLMGSNVERAYFVTARINNRPNEVATLGLRFVSDIIDSAFIRELDPIATANGIGWATVPLDDFNDRSMSKIAKPFFVSSSTS